MSNVAVVFAAQRIPRQPAYLSRQASRGRVPDTLGTRGHVNSSQRTLGMGKSWQARDVGDAPKAAIETTCLDHGTSFFEHVAGFRGPRLAPDCRKTCCLGWAAVTATYGRFVASGAFGVVGITYGWDLLSGGGLVV